MPIGVVRCVSYVQFEKPVVVEHHPCVVQMVAFLWSATASFGVEWAAVAHHGGVVVVCLSSFVVGAWAFAHEEGPQLVASCAVAHHLCGVPLNVGGHHQDVGGEFVVAWQVVVRHPWGVEYYHGREHYLVG